MDGDKLAEGGTSVGLLDGATLTEGERLGNSEGEVEGKADTVGLKVGLGVLDGKREGRIDGGKLGEAEKLGWPVGKSVGRTDTEGAMVGFGVVVGF
mmetsp:Transcript_7354/g.16739  ORF Transcript_7354/g.16739 Transcript_7354/m.16739 type:complete len:96 (+) Transcript_7354:615-902(+)